MARREDETTTGGRSMVAERLEAVCNRVYAAAERAERDPSEITLVAVSKGRSAEAVLAAYEAGQRDFGENRSVELAAKAPSLPDDIRWHFIGSLQTRQAKIARPHTALLHSLDRSRLANVWSTGEPVPPALIQVNVAGEAQKHGIEPQSAGQLLEQAVALGIPCRGLMTMAPLSVDPEDSRRWFRELRLLRDGFQVAHPDLVELSMGMTDDYEVAIEEGATIIRVGRAIFGPPGLPALSD